MYIFLHITLLRVCTYYYILLVIIKYVEILLYIIVYNHISLKILSHMIIYYYVYVHIITGGQLSNASFFPPKSHGTFIYILSRILSHIHWYVYVTWSLAVSFLFLNLLSNQIVMVRKTNTCIHICVMCYYVCYHWWSTFLSAAYCAATTSR